MQQKYNFALLLILFVFIKVQSQTIDTLITVGNHQLHFKIIKGKGTPILFQSGNGDDGSVWEDLLNSIHKQTDATLITYDRAGLGKSGIDTLNIGFKKEVKNLEFALKQLGYTKNLFIVCHSFGGFYATLFALRNKKRVKGAIYIDTVLPCFMTKEWSTNFVNSISKDDWQLIKQYKIGLYYVLQNLASISDYMSNKQLPKSIPAILIAAEELQPMIKETEVEKWRKCLKSFEDKSKHNYILAKKAKHKVWVDRPELVINEIVKLYKKIH